VNLALLSQAMKEIPELESLLYDLDLMPEQVKKTAKTSGRCSRLPLISIASAML
jgi:hypothetical protein